MDRSNEDEVILINGKRGIYKVRRLAKPKVRVAVDDHVLAVPMEDCQMDLSTHAIGPYPLNYILVGEGYMTTLAEVVRYLFDLGESVTNSTSPEVLFEWNKLISRDEQ